jgi:FkbH-like protein
MDTKANPPTSITPGDAALLLAQIDDRPTLVNINTAARRIAPIASSLASVQKRLACLSSFTIDFLKTPLELQALRAGLHLQIHVAAYGQVDQELIDPNSGVASFNPDVVLIAVRLRDVCPSLYDAFNSLSPNDAKAMIDDWLARFKSALMSFRQHSQAHLLILNYEAPVAPALGIADSAAANSQSQLIRAANESLDAIAAAVANAHVLDYDALIASHGRSTWEDRRMALYGRIPVAAQHYWPFAGFIVRYLRPMYGLTKKVLVLDADNTLWGGVIGDVGVDGIALGHDYPGSAFVAFQKRVLDLYHRGIVLCIASKNQPGIVEEALKTHPDMVLREKHFAAMRVNWNPKPQNLQEMAADLNLGIDSFVFLDDNDVECALMREALPQVLTICLPKEPARYAAVVENLDCFDQFSVSAEDRVRGELYRAESGRRQLQSAVVDMPTFYRQLAMKVTFGINQSSQISRAAQMTNRTNQFNMHTIRCSEDDIRRFMDSGDHEVITLALEDRFGDSGVVGLAIVRKSPQEWVLHQFLMSCRILGRTVEQAFVKWIAGRAKSAGAAQIIGQFAPTTKNKPFAGFYKSCGFAANSTDSAPDEWILPLPNVDTSIPDWIAIQPPATEVS